MKPSVEWELAGETKVLIENLPNANLSVTNRTWRDLWSNPGLRGGKPATNCVSCGTAPCVEINRFYAYKKNRWNCDFMFILIVMFEVGLSTIKTYSPYEIASIPVLICNSSPHLLLFSPNILSLPLCLSMTKPLCNFMCHGSSYGRGLLAPTEPTSLRTITCWLSVAAHWIYSYP
jgi:hypothetical protein